MKSHLLQWLLLISILAYVKSEVTNVKIMKILKSTSAPSGEETETTTICFDTIIPAADVCTLTVHEDHETDYPGLETSIDRDCEQFNVAISIFYGDGLVVVNCGETATDTSFLAQATLNIPDITNVKVQFLGETTVEKDIRVSGITDTSDSWKVLVNDSPKTCTSNGNVCFVINSGITDASAQVVVCATVPNTLVTEGSENIDVCTDKINADLVTQKGPDVNDVTLVYDSKTLQISFIENDPPTSYDVVASVGSNTKVYSVKDATSPIKITEDSFTPGVQVINVLVAGVTDVAVESQHITLQDHNLVAKLFGTTIEMEWDNSVKSFYYANIVSSSSKSAFDNTIVNCNDLDYCYAYFINVEETEKQVQVRPCETEEESTCNKNNIIEAQVVPELILDKSTDLRIQDIHLHWSSDSLTVDAGVCFRGEATGLTQYQLVLVDAVGRWRRVQGASHTTTEGRMCFSGVTLDSRQFNTTDKVAVLVIKRDVDGRTVLASTESHVFFISPKVEVVSGHAGLVSWGNPGGYTVSTRKESHPASVTAPTTGKLRHYFVPRKTEDRLLVEAEASGVKMTALVPLTGTAAADNIQSVTINEIVMYKEPTSGFQICYEDELTEIVTHAEITLVKFDDTPQTTMVATTVDPCPTFDNPIGLDDSRTVFELRLYTGDTGSYVQVGRSSLDSTMSGIKDLAKCSSGNQVGDGKMLRLSCDSAFNQDTDKITVADTLLQILKASNFISGVQYLLLNSDLPSDGDLKVYREVSVTMNDSPQPSTVNVMYGGATYSVTPNTQPNVDTLTLEYGTPANVKATLADSSNNNYDLVNYWSEGERAEVYTLLVCPALGADALSCELTHTQGTSIMNVLLVGYTDPDKMSESGVYLLQDYNIEGSFVFSSTIEWKWTMEPPGESLVRDYLATIQLDDSNSEPNPTFTTAKVTCDESETACYVYFLGLSDANSYAVMIQPKLDSDYNNMNMIISEKVPVVSPPRQMTASTDKLMVEEVELDWRRDGVRVDVGVCFQHRDATVDATGLTQYQLVLVDAEGRWRHVHGASHTREGRLCFSRVTLDSRQFNTGEEVAVLVIKRDVDGRTVLASGESHVFFITPEIKAVGGHVGRISWDNPGGYSLTTMMEGHYTHLAAPTTGRLRHYFFPKKTEERLVVEADASGVKMTAVVPLTSIGAAGM